MIFFCGDDMSTCFRAHCFGGLLIVLCANTAHAQVVWKGITWSHLYGSESVAVNPSTGNLDITITGSYGGVYHPLPSGSQSWIQATYLDAPDATYAPSPTLVAIDFDTPTSSYEAWVGALNGDSHTYATIRRDSPLETIVSQTLFPIAQRASGAHCAAVAQASDGTIDYWLDGVLQQTVPPSSFLGQFQYAYLVGQASTLGQVVSFVDYREGSGTYPNLCESNATGLPILSVTGPPVNNSLGIFPSNPIAISFTVEQSYSNVTVSADLIGSFSGTAYLMNQIGPGTSVTNQIATGLFTSTDLGSGTVQAVLTNVAIPGPGTYYIVLSTAQTNPPQGLQETNSPVVVAVAGVSYDALFGVAGGGGVGAYAPAASFTQQSNQFGVAYAPEFTVTGTPNLTQCTFSLSPTGQSVGAQGGSRKSLKNAS